MGAEQPGGVQVRLAVESADACPVAAATENGDTARSVTWSRAADGDEVVEEFELVGGTDPDGSTDGDGESSLPPGGSVVFDTDQARRVRFAREGADCICDRVERRGTPVTDVRAARGTLLLTFHATDVETVRSVVAELNEVYGSVRIDRVSRTDGEGGDDLVLVDRGELTDRQREVLETAKEMGYFRRPRGANATQVAEELGIAPSTFAEHLASAQSKVLDSLLEGSA